jgi:hypothetical protein
MNVLEVKVILYAFSGKRSLGENFISFWRIRLNISFSAFANVWERDCLQQFRDFLFFKNKTS